MQLGRRLLPKVAGVSAFGALYLFDKHYCAESVQRSARTFTYALLIAADYKLNFVPGDDPTVYSGIHKRTADRLLTVFRKNQGLYIKLGQVMALQSEVMPKEFHSVFRELFDRAPGIPYETVKTQIEQELQSSLNDLFAEFNPVPVASASIAQVHQARLHSGELVAVKVQKPLLRRQMEWDLAAYKVIMYAFEKLFDLPLMWAVDYTQKHLRMEVDFENEARNSERVQEHLKDSELAENVYVPKVYWPLTTKIVLTTKWIDAVKITEVDALKAKGLSAEKAMETAVDLFAFQIFKSGFLHCNFMG